MWLLLFLSFFLLLFALKFTRSNAYGLLDAKGGGSDDDNDDDGDGGGGDYYLT